MSATPAAFPLCAEEAVSRALWPLLDQTVSRLHRELGDDAIESTVLTGSLARGEGSARLDGNKIDLLGDMEFIVIARPPFDYAALRRRMLALGESVTNEWASLGHRATVEFTPAGMSYLRKTIRPSIFAYDLLTHGKVVRGRRDVLQEARIPIDRIPRDDAVRLVSNRMMELYCLSLRDDVGSRQRAYLAVKTTLDLAGSVLAFVDRYESLYERRREALRTCRREVRELSVAIPWLDALEAELEGAIECKLRPTEQLLCRHEEAFDRVTALCSRVWCWEMSLMTGGSSFRELVQHYLTGESFGQRLRGWVKYYLHPFRPERERFHPLRHLRLLRVSSPQRLAFASALLSQHASDARESVWSRPAELLPTTTTDENALSGAIDLWSWLVRNN